MVEERAGDELKQLAEVGDHLRLFRMTRLAFRTDVGVALTFLP